MQEQSYDKNRLQDEAAAWLARLLSDTVSQRDKHRFSEWLNVSGSHTQAFDEMVDAWESSAVAARLVYEAEQRAAPETTPRGLFSWLKDIKFWQGGLAFACLAGLAGLAALTYTLLSTAPPAATAVHYATLAGEQKRIQLADGSVVELNTQSSLSVAYSDAQRILTLSEGEAYFEVKPDKQRPFVVDVGRGTVTAVGTAFNIYHKPRETVISVTEGVVDVREKKDAATPSPNRERVNIEQQISFNNRGLSRVQATDLRKVTAWREKTLIFDNIELSAAIAELNRYLKRPANAEHSSLSGLRVSGTFSLDAPEATLQALIASFDLVAEQSSPQAPLYLRSE